MSTLARGRTETSWPDLTWWQPSSPSFEDGHSGVNEDSERVYEPHQLSLLWGLVPDLLRESLREYFTKYGDITEVMVMKDPTTRRSRLTSLITLTWATTIDTKSPSETHQHNFPASIALDRPTGGARLEMYGAAVHGRALRRCDYGIARINEYTKGQAGGILRFGARLQAFDDVAGFAGLVNQSTGTTSESQGSVWPGGYNRIIRAGSD
ncbi:RNA-binding protein Musashi like protein Rbp6 [Dufourea novaeangliae]|uniref:RNA-binding protein Musashi like protein Rbp6 n=1 Tax=Dufourea novaeangliae TaxID=178035 RepID=A0A154P6Z1_DUFNO|nr:RNA-binding protein Musashi like protein Rbp6 [Dufourea novaeangliae]